MRERIWRGRDYDRCNLHFHLEQLRIAGSGGQNRMGLDKGGIPLAPSGSTAPGTGRESGGVGWVRHLEARGGGGSHLLLTHQEEERR